MGKKKSYWYDDFWDFEWGKKKKGHSASSYWTSRFGGSHWWQQNDDPADKAAEKYKEALRSVTRTVNVYTSFQNEKNEELSVQWSSGENENTLKSKIVYLSPNIIAEGHTKKKDWSGDELLDVLIGDALTESAHKHVASLMSEEHATAEWEGKKLTTVLWQVSEVLAAQASVVSKYPGFKAYFEANRDYHTDEKAFENIQKMIDAMPANAELATVATLWELLHPEESLKLPKEQYEDEIEKAIEKITKTKTTLDRAETAKDVIRRFLEKWPPPEDKKKKQEGDGQGGEGGGGGRKGPLSAFLNGKNMGIPPQGMIANAVAKKLAAMKVNPGASTEDGEKSELHSHGIYLGDDPPNGVVDIKVRTDPHRTHSYNALLTKVMPLVTKMAAGLRFRDEEKKMYERGLKTGDIDAGAIYKVGFEKYGVKDRSLFERTDVISAPDAAISLVVDESGSMGCVEKISAAQRMAIIMANALKRCHGVSFAVFGHTGDGRCHGSEATHKMAFHHYYTPSHFNMETMGGIASFSNNYDGYAIKRAAEYMLLWWLRVPQKMVIHLSDGLPAATNYGGETAHRHVNKVCNRAMRNGIKVCGIHFGRDYDDVHTKGIMNAMYGAKNWVHVNNPDSSIPYVIDLVTRSLKEAYQQKES